MEPIITLANLEHVDNMNRPNSRERQDNSYEFGNPHRPLVGSGYLHTSFHFRNESQGHHVSMDQFVISPSWNATNWDALRDNIASDHNASFDDSAAASSQPYDTRSQYPRRVHPLSSPLSRTTQPRSWSDEGITAPRDLPLRPRSTEAVYPHSRASTSLFHPPPGLGNTASNPSVFGNSTSYATWQTGSEQRDHNSGNATTLHHLRNSHSYYGESAYAETQGNYYRLGSVPNNNNLSFTNAHKYFLEQDKYASQVGLRRNPLTTPDEYGQNRSHPDPWRGTRHLSLDDTWAPTANYRVPGERLMHRNAYSFPQMNLKHLAESSLVPYRNEGNYPQDGSIGRFQRAYYSSGSGEHSPMSDHPDRTNFHRKPSFAPSHPKTGSGTFERAPRVEKGCVQSTRASRKYHQTRTPKPQLNMFKGKCNEALRSTASTVSSAYRVDSLSSEFGSSIEQQSISTPVEQPSSESIGFHSMIENKGDSRTQSDVSIQSAESSEVEAIEVNVGLQLDALDDTSRGRIFNYFNRHPIEYTFKDYAAKNDLSIEDVCEDHIDELVKFYVDELKRTVNLRKTGHFLTKDDRVGKSRRDIIRAILGPIVREELEKRILSHPEWSRYLVRKSKH